MRTDAMPGGGNKSSISLTVSAVIEMESEEAKGALHRDYLIVVLQTSPKFRTQVSTSSPHPCSTRPPCTIRT